MANFTKIATTDPYATAAQSAAVLRSGAEFRKNRMAAADMLTTQEAADLAGVSRVTISAWIKQGRCIGVIHLRHRFKLPNWRFDPQAFDFIQALSAASGNVDGWALLAFLENPHAALDRRTPLVALAQGESVERILQLAVAKGHQWPCSSPTTFSLKQTRTIELPTEQDFY